MPGYVLLSSHEANLSIFFWCAFTNSGGLIHGGVENDYYARGAMSLYVPESYDGTAPLPLVVCLHGGFGHGSDFIWAWIREARSRKFLLLSPTSIDTTWSILNPQLDGTALYKMIDHVGNNWRIDPNRILLTGISDGGTFALMCSLQQHSPFTAFAPIASTLPPMDLSNAKDKRILWTHGALDWMFPVHMIQPVCEMLKTAGVGARPIIRQAVSLAAFQVFMES